MSSNHIFQIIPVASLLIALTGASTVVEPVFLGPANLIWPFLELVAIVGAVFASVHHADAIAHHTGEPFGTLVLTVAVTVIEVALIVSIMLAGGAASTLARDTVFAVVMIVCNGLVGLCLVLGGLRYGEQGFRVPGASAYLSVLIPLATLALIMPNYTTSEPGPFLSDPQLVFMIVATLALYAVFLYVQTIRHRDYFLSDPAAALGNVHLAYPSSGRIPASVLLLLFALAAVVLLAKNIADAVRDTASALGAPPGAVGLLVAGLVLLPESLAAVRAAKHNELQKSLNLALGSSLATIGLTIPVIGAVSVLFAQPVALGLEPRDSVLLTLTFAVSVLTFGVGRTNILPGFVHLVLFAAYVFLIFAP